MRSIPIIALAICLLAWPVAGQEIIGTALALDGDTILVTPKSGKPVKVRLWGVDAPEMKVWPWGQRARMALDRILHNGGNLVHCAQTGKNRNRIVGVCVTKRLRSPSVRTPHQRLEKIDIGEQLIAEGYAVEYRWFSRGTYAKAERNAQDGKRGVWAR